jgi:Major Facilitator Superfamily.
VLGISEGGMLPVVLTMVSNWFPEKGTRARQCLRDDVRAAGWHVYRPISGYIINVLDWRWLFIIEGLLSAAVLLVWWLVIADRPEEARWLPAREKAYLLRELARERAAHRSAAPVNKAPLKAVFRNSGLMKLVALNFFYQTGDYGYTLWLPSILKNLTGTNMAGSAC